MAHPAAAWSLAGPLVSPPEHVLPGLVIVGLLVYLRWPAEEGRE